jgi:hypothetical protein
MRPETLRVGVTLILVALGFLFPPSRWAYGCWTLAAVYALLTSPRRFL